MIRRVLALLILVISLQVHTNGASYTHLVQYQTYLDVQTNQLYVRLISRANFMLICNIRSNQGAYFSVTLYPSSQRAPYANVSGWYPVGYRNAVWEYSC